jgi:hypothetical protein
LDRLNIKAPESDQWEHTTVGRILRNEVYIGKIIWGKIKHTKIDGKYEKRLLPRESWQITENAHTAIISEDLFKKVNAESKRRWTIPVIKDKKLTNPLAGLIVCSNCDKSMVRYPRPDRPNDMIRCSNHKCKGIQKGAAFALVEDKILQTLESLIEDFDLPEVEKKRSKPTIKLKEKALIVMEKEKKELEIQSDNIHEMLEKKVYSIDTFLQRQHVLKEKLIALDNKIESINKEIEIEQKHQKAQTSFIPKVKSVLETYRSTNDIGMKNKLLKTVIYKAYFTRKVEWTKRDQFIIHLDTKI